MDRLSIDIFKRPVLNNPILVCGLPGSGFVGKIAVEYLITELKAKMFGVIYSYNFPPQIKINQDGTLDILRNEMYYSLSKYQDIIFYTGDSQPVTQGSDYEIAEKVLDITSKMGVKKVFTLAAYITGNFVKEPKVYGTGTDIKITKELINHGVLQLSEGTITGMNGLILGLAKVKGIQGASLLGETSGYIIDANASKAILDIFSKVINLKIDMSNLIKRIQSTKAVINTLNQLRKGNEYTVGKDSERERNLGYIS